MNIHRFSNSNLYFFSGLWWIALRRFSQYFPWSARTNISLSMPRRMITTLIASNLSSTLSSSPFGVSLPWLPLGFVCWFTKLWMILSQAFSSSTTCWVSCLKYYIPMNALSCRCRRLRLFSLCYPFGIVVWIFQTDYHRKAMPPTREHVQANFRSSSHWLSEIFVRADNMTESVISSVRDELSSLDSLSASSLVSLLIREISKNFFHHVGHASHQSCFCDDSQMLSCSLMLRKPTPMRRHPPKEWETPQQACSLRHHHSHSDPCLCDNFLWCLNGKWQALPSNNHLSYPREIHQLLPTVAMLGFVMRAALWRAVLAGYEFLSLSYEYLLGSKMMSLIAIKTSLPSILHFVVAKPQQYTNLAT